MTKPDYAKAPANGRINARIDRVAEEQLRYVSEHTQINVTEALRASIALMYDNLELEPMHDLIERCIVREALNGADGFLFGGVGA